MTGAPDVEPTTAPPWGVRRPGPGFRALLAASRAVPQAPVVKQLAFLLRRAARALVEDPVDVVHGGLRLRLRTRGNISESTFLFMPRRWDVPERRFLARHLAPGAVFVDVGANAGGYVWAVLGLLGRGCRIVAVEPDPDLGRRLRFNAATNGFDNVEVVGAAVGPASAVGEGEAWLRVDRRNRGQNVLSSAPVGDGGGVRVPVRPLPELLEGLGVARVDALKVDVEGMEPAILEDFFRRAPEGVWPRVLLVELPGTPEHRELEARLEALGYAAELRSRLNVGLVRA